MHIFSRCATLCLYHRVFRGEEITITYQVLSKYRTELMGLAIFWVMLFHAHDLDLGINLLNDIRGIGFGGVDIFILLSAMGLVMSRGGGNRTIPPSCPDAPVGYCPPSMWSWSPIPSF